MLQWLQRLKDVRPAGGKITLWISLLLPLATIAAIGYDRALTRNEVRPFAVPPAVEAERIRRAEEARAALQRQREEAMTRKADAKSAEERAKIDQAVSQIDQSVQTLSQMSTDGTGLTVQTAPMPTASGDLGLRRIFEAAREKEWFATAIAAVIAFVVLALSVLVCGVSFFVHLFSKDEKRSDRAGRILKTSFGYILSSGVAVMTFLGFNMRS